MTRHILLARAPPSVLPGYMIAAGAFGFVAAGLLLLGHTALDVFPANNFLSGTDLGNGAGMDAMGMANAMFMIGVWMTLMCTGMFGYIAVVFIGWGIVRLGLHVVKGKADHYKIVRISNVRGELTITGIMVVDIPLVRDGGCMGEISAVYAIKRIWRLDLCE
jgi:hypothetical protein